MASREKKIFSYETLVSATKNFNVKLGERSLFDMSAFNERLQFIFEVFIFQQSSHIKSGQFVLLIIKSEFPFRVNAL